MGLPCSEVTDYRLYAIALKSLRTALDGSRPLRTESLAALSVMERYEHMFDAGRRLHLSSHRAGMATVMKILGPPKSDDEMAIYLHLDSYVLIVSDKIRTPFIA
jgi:hypothetical protein